MERTFLFHGIFVAVNGGAENVGNSGSIILAAQVMSGVGLLVLVALLIASWVWFLFREQTQNRRFEVAKKAREKVEKEETRVFDFLHGLGEAFLEEIHAEDLHRLIVE